MEELTNGLEKMDLNDNCTFVLEPCEILSQINLDILKKYVKKDIDANKEYFDDRKITYKISDPKKGEWILCKSIENSKLVGDGNTNIDIFIKDLNIGIDVSVLSLTKNTTNEKSIIQNFTTGNELDSLFLNGKGIEIVDIFKNKILEKYNSKSSEIKELYYAFFICEKQNIYLSYFKLNISNIANMNFDTFTEKSKSANVNNFIDNKYGETKIYKSKKRLELRLNKNIINEFCSVKLY